MDEYTEATSGEETLVDFAVQRAESILAQLSGDLIVEAETESSMGGGENGAPPGINGNMGQKGAGNSSSSKDTIILSSVLLILLLGAIAFAHFFKRRGKKG